MAKIEITRSALSVQGVEAYQLSYHWVGPEDEAVIVLDSFLEVALRSEVYWHFDKLCIGPFVLIAIGRTIEPAGYVCQRRKEEEWPPERPYLLFAWEPAGLAEGIIGAYESSFENVSQAQAAARACFADGKTAAEIWMMDAFYGLTRCWVASQGDQHEPVWRQV